MGGGCLAVLQCDPLLGGYVGEGAVAVVMIKEIRITRSDHSCARSGDEQVEIAIVIVVTPNGSPCIGVIIRAGLCCNIGEGAVAVVPIKRVVLVSFPVGGAMSDIKVEQAIVIVVAPGNTLRV